MNRIINYIKNIFKINKKNIEEEKPWIDLYGNNIPHTLDYEMGSMYGDMFKGAKAKETMILNLSNSMIKNVSDLSDEDKKLFCKQIYDLAKISNKQLSSNEMSEFMQRSISILKKAFNN